MQVQGGERVGIRLADEAEGGERDDGTRQPLAAAHRDLGVEEEAPVAQLRHVEKLDKRQSD